MVNHKSDTAACLDVNYFKTPTFSIKRNFQHLVGKMRLKFGGEFVSLLRLESNGFRKIIDCIVSGDNFMRYC